MADEHISHLWENAKSISLSFMFISAKADEEF